MAGLMSSCKVNHLNSWLEHLEGVLITHQLSKRRIWRAAFQWQLWKLWRTLGVIAQTIGNASLNSALVYSASEWVRMGIATLMQIVWTVSTAEQQLTGLIGLFAHNKRDPMSSVIQTMNVRTPCIAGSLLQLIAITTLQSAYLCIVKAETPFSGGIR